MKKRILHLTLKKVYFDLTATGVKKTEYRDITPYWTSRFHNPNGSMKRFDEVWSRNGYHEDSPFLRVVWLDLNIAHWDNKWAYAISLGDLLEVRN